MKWVRRAAIGRQISRATYGKRNTGPLARFREECTMLPVVVLYPTVHTIAGLVFD